MACVGASGGVGVCVSERIGAVCACVGRHGVGGRVAHRQSGRLGPFDGTGAAEAETAGLEAGAGTGVAECHGRRSEVASPGAPASLLGAAPEARGPATPLC